MSEDFIVEEEGSGGPSPSRRPFFIAAGVLTLTLILAGICAGSALLGGNGTRSNGNEAAIQTRIAENEEIAVTNTAVAMAIEAMTVEAMTRAAMPTETLVPTNTPVPSATPLPTNTPVIAQAVGTETPEISGTTEFTAGPGANTPTPIALAGGGAGSGGGTLPDTGFASIWAPLLAALAFIGIFLGARRLRSS